MANPEVVEWKWGPVADMRHDGTEWHITAWRHPSEPEPTRGQLTAAAAEYAARDRKAERVAERLGQDDVLNAVADYLADKFGDPPEKVRADIAERLTATTGAR